MPVPAPRMMKMQVGAQGWVGRIANPPYMPRVIFGVVNMFLGTPPRTKMRSVRSVPERRGEMW